MSSSGPVLSRNVSERIRIARVICILFMVTVHFWPGDARLRVAEAPFHLRGLYILIVDYLGRSSVPLLSVISGALLVFSFATKSPRSLLKQKAATLLVPMVVWSVALVALDVIMGAADGDLDRLPATPMAMLNSVFALTQEPRNFPLAFLRDVFLASVLSVAALIVWRRSAAIAIALLLGVTIVELAFDGIVLLRPQILVFQVAGVVLARTGCVGDRLRAGWPMVMLLFAVVAMDHAVDALGDHAALRIYLVRAAMLLCVWEVAIAVQTSGGRAARLAFSIEPHVFVIFCSHVIFIMLLGPVWKFIGIWETSSLYPIIFVAQFGLVVCGSVTLSILIRRHSPWAGRPRNASSASLMKRTGSAPSLRS